MNIKDIVRIDRAFFKRHQRALLFIFNTKIGRWFFRIQEHEIGKKFIEVHPNALVWKNDGKNVIEFRTANKYANRIKSSLGFLKVLLKLSAALGVRSFAKFETAFLLSPILLMGTSTDFFPNADAETTSVDGKATHTAGGLGSGVAWATLRAGTGTSSSDAVADELAARWVADNVSNQWRIQDRGFFLFDTSALTSGATISAATLSLYVHILTAPTDATASKRELRVVSSNPASNTGLTGTDYATIGSTEFGHITYGSVSIDAYNDVSLNASGLSNISKTGISKFGTLSGADMDNSAPTWALFDVLAYQIKFAEASGTSTDPKLTVTYTTLTTSTITKGLQYCIKSTPATITKTLQYVVTNIVSVTLTKSLQYAVRSSVAAITKSLRYCVKITPATITKAMAYNIASPTTIQKTLTYSINFIPQNIGCIVGIAKRTNIGEGSDGSGILGKSANTGIGIGAKL